MRILFLHQFVFGKDQPGISKQVEMLKYLAKFGHETRVISGFFSHITRKRVEKYKGKYFCQEVIEGIEVIRVPSFFNLTSFRRKVLNYSIFMLMAVVGGLASGSCDVIFASSPPLPVGIAGYILSILKRVPFVLEIRDLQPEDLVEEGNLKPGLIYHLLWKITSFLYRRASKIVGNTQGICERIVARGIEKNKVELITNAADVEIFLSSKPKGDSFRKELGFNDQFLTIYAGGHGMVNSLETIIEAARCLREYNDIFFILVGDGEKKEDLIRMKENYQLKNVFFVPPQPKNRMPEVFASADVAIVTLKNVRIYEGALPNKLFDSMASGLPVVLAIGGEAKRLIEEAHGGIAVEPENPQALAKAVLSLYKERVLAKDMGKNGQDYVVKHYSRREIAQKLELILKEIIPSSSVCRQV